MPDLPAFGATDYLTQFQRLLPRGRIWHRGWGRVQDADLLTLMPTWSRLHARLNALIGEIFPCSTLELLTEWEATLGLPDPCVGELGSVQQRVRAVCAKFAARGGQSKTYYRQVAAALGFSIEIHEFTPFTAGWPAGLPVYGESWAHTWSITAVADMVWYFSAGISTAGEPLRIWGNRLLECVFERIKPAHTILLFRYVGSLWDSGRAVWDDGLSIWDTEDNAERD
jgi:uncharacterized protein YmfQ (DUF2313 family)